MKLKDCPLHMRVYLKTFFFSTSLSLSLCVCVYVRMCDLRATCPSLLFLARHLISFSVWAGSSVSHGRWGQCVCFGD